jgi:hypothetical protein
MLFCLAHNEYMMIVALSIHRPTIVCCLLAQTIITNLTLSV